MFLLTKLGFLNSCTDCFLMDGALADGASAFGFSTRNSSLLGGIGVEGVTSVAFQVSLDLSNLRHTLQTHLKWNNVFTTSSAFLQTFLTFLTFTLEDAFLLENSVSFGFSYQVPVQNIQDEVGEKSK